jgi:hypothetical protein
MTDATKNLKRNSHYALVVRGEFPDSLSLEPSDSGSFDCVCRRFAPANFAQDDSVKNGELRITGP